MVALKRSRNSVAVTILFGSLGWCSVALAQNAPDAGNAPPAQQQPPRPAPQSPPPGGVTVQTPHGTCVQPPRSLGWQDYDGPFAKFLGLFTEKLEIKSVHPPRYKAGALLCTLTVEDKFQLFVRDSIEPGTFLNAAFNAGIDQAQNGDPSYGQGMAGYGKRFGASLAGATSGEFFKDFLYPTIFEEDPRYYRLGEGEFRRRFFHAMGHSVIAYRVDGTRMFNVSEWLGTASAVVLANTYRPDNRRGVGPAAERTTEAVGSDAGFDVLREFFPEIARKFKLPFRDRNEVKN